MTEKNDASPSTGHDRQQAPDGAPGANRAGLSASTTTQPACDADYLDAPTSVVIDRDDGSAAHLQTYIDGAATEYHYRDGRLVRRGACPATAAEIEHLCMSNMLANPGERFFFKDRHSRFLMVSAAWLAAVGHGWRLDQVIGKTDFDIAEREQARVAFEDEQRVIATGVAMPVKVERDWLPDRPEAWVSTSKVPLLDEQGNIVGTWGIARDVTAQVNAEQALVHQALHDSTTGLANRVLLMDRLSQALIACERRGGCVALLFADLDAFKGINDRLGHEAGDQVLAEVGRRLTLTARRGDTVARFGGDEFVVLCTGLTADADLQVIGDRLAGAIRAPMDVAGHELIVTASVGAIVTADPHVEPAELLRQADHALYGAKRAGRDRLAVYDPEAHLGGEAAAGLAGDLRQAIDRAELFVVYQPLFRLADGAIVGAEALVRWRHPQRGVVPPDEFIPLAEERGLIAEVDAFVLDEACRQLALWRADDHAWDQVVMSVNISGRELSDRGLVDRVAGALERHGIPPAQLCLEITETALLGELGDVSRVLESLTGLGVHLSLDDFGTGYSALSHLQRLRTDTLKIDRSFIAQIGEQTRDHQITAGVTAMAHALGMTVVGEGIETAGQWERLIELGCDTGQGYIFARPMSAEEFAALRASGDPPTRVGGRGREVV